MLLSLVANAGVSGFSAEHPQGPIWEVHDEAWEKAMSVNVNGVVQTLKAGIPHMIKQEPAADGKRGRIVNLASIMGLIGAAGACMWPLNTPS